MITKITTLFLDIGGVLMTNGWDRHMRQNAAQHFHLEIDELEKRHHLLNDLYETDQLSLDDYLQEVVFWKQRDFDFQAFKKFMFSQSLSYPDAIQYFKEIKEKHGLKIVAISNEGKELGEYRIKLADLKSLMDSFFVSAFVGYQKPNPLLFSLVLNVTQVSLSEVLYIDDRKELVDSARTLGLNGIVHQSLEETKKSLAKVPWA